MGSLNGWGLSEDFLLTKVYEQEKENEGKRVILALEDYFSKFINQRNRKIIVILHLSLIIVEIRWRAELFLRYFYG